MGLTRRQLLALLPGAVASTALAGGAARAEASGPVALIDIEALLPEAPLPLEAWEAMSHLEMAKRSPLAIAAAKQCVAYAKEIEDASLRTLVLDLLQNPTPTFLEAGPSQGRQKSPGLQRAAHLTAGQMPQTPQTPLTFDAFLAAPGSHWKGHHAYPGGLPLHIAPNALISLGIRKTYIKTYGFAPDKDVVLAAQLLHDCMKPWVFTWQADGSSHPEGKIAGTSAHHVFSLAEAMHRGAPEPVLHALACAHGTRPKKSSGKGPQDWLDAAALLVDRPAPPLPAPLPVEGFLIEHGDADWRFTSTAATACRRFVEGLAIRQYDIPESEQHSKRFNVLRNALCSTLTMERMYYLFQSLGQDAVTKLAARIVTAST